MPPALCLEQVPDNIILGVVIMFACIMAMLGIVFLLYFIAFVGTIVFSACLSMGLPGVILLVILVYWGLNKVLK